MSVTKLRQNFSRTFSVRHSSVARRLSNLGSGGRVRSPRVRLGVDLGGRGRGRRGGVFPKTTLDFLDSLQTRPDPTRPRPRSPTFISYPSTRPPPTQPHSHTGEQDAPCWALFISGAFSHCQYWEYWEVQNCRYPNPMMLSVPAVREYHQEWSPPGALALSPLIAQRTYTIPGPNSVQTHIIKTTNVPA